MYFVVWMSYNILIDPLKTNNIVMYKIVETFANRMSIFYSATLYYVTGN